jgi:MoxR-like ATPase
MTPIEAFQQLRQRIAAEIIGQEAIIERVLVALLADGHVLMEGLPGLAKTRTIKTLAKQLDSQFSRIQFTPDLLPADVTGTEIYVTEGGNSEFRFQAGPVFGNIILADEINRAPAKAQAALLEAMEERQVTVAGKTHKLPPVYLVMATQNPIEQEGTYPLPEAQMDRFLLKLVIGYPTDADEARIMELVRNEATGQGVAEQPKLPLEVITAARQQVNALFTAPPLVQYMVSLVAATRRPEQFGPNLKKWIQVGASPRGTLALDKASRAFAWLQGRDHTTPDDVRAIAVECLRHRLISTYEASADGVTPEQIVAEVLKQVAVPS